MSAIRSLVERFYRELWDAHDASRVAEILHEHVVFRGSLGDEKRGHAGFLEYVDGVHRALAGYRCVIEDLVVEPPKAFARMTFEGEHVGDFLGFAPTGRRVRWSGAALFTFAGDRIAQVWVLGDRKGLEECLGANAAAARG